MKKLLISIVATASLALVAKADVAPLNATSFEALDSGKITAANKDAFLYEGANIYWTGFAEDSDLTVTALEGAKGDVVRPKYWADKADADAKALAIDVDTPLVRNIATAEGAGVPQAIGNGLYFDSMVQFTATEEAPDPTDGDKLIVWLKETSAEEGSTEEGSTYKLCVTAGVWTEGGSATATVYENTNPEITVSKDEWCRLTISVSKNQAEYPVFRVFVNGKLFKSGEVSEFNSLAGTTPNDANQITSVSFKGKGAIDDLVWTTEDPFVDPTAEVALSFTYADGLTENDNVCWYYDGEKEIVADNGKASLNFAVGTKVVFTCETPVGYTVKDFAKGEEADGVITWTSQEYTVAAEGLELAFEITKDKPFMVNGEAYETLADAISNANGATITVTEDIEPATSFEITTTVTIDLKGKTIKANDNDTAGNGVFWVKTGGVLTLLDSSDEQTGTVDGNGGSGYKMAVWADGGKVVINGGTYKNLNSEGDDQYDLIYVKNGGLVEITGGTFKCQTPRWTLNSHNSLAGTFVVTGGKFYGYDPSKINTDEPTVTSWCPAGYEAKVDGNGYYVVTEKKVETVKPGASVAVDSEEDAKAVEIEVEVPTGVDITEEAYKAYFKKSIELNSETGKYEVSAVLNEEVVTPVIEATTGEDGAVTPAISFDSDGKVTINISNELRGLFYGVKYATTVGGVETAAAIPGLTVTPKAGGTAGFFRVVVDFKEIPEPAAK